jgi:hypothetical protein
MDVVAVVCQLLAEAFHLPKLCALTADAGELPAPVLEIEPA